MLNSVKCTVHVVTLGIETGFCYVDAYFAFAEWFCCVPPAPYGNNTVAVGPLISSGLTTGATYTWGL